MRPKKDGKNVKETEVASYSPNGKGGNKPVKLQDMIWYADALLFVESYGVDPAIIEAAAKHPTSVTDDPKTQEVGYPVRRHRRGDIEVVVGFREEDEPAILYVRLHTPDEVIVRGSKGASGSGNSQIPSTMRGLRYLIVSSGFSIKPGGRHDKVLDPDGNVVMTLASTPSDARTIPNSYREFMRAYDKRRTEEALLRLAEEVREEL